MPRLVLYDDDGRELFAGDVSQSNVQIIARFLRRNMGALRAAAVVKQAISSFLAPMGPDDPLLRPPPRRPPPLRPPARARGKR